MSDRPAQKNALDAAATAVEGTNRTTQQRNRFMNTVPNYTAHTATLSTVTSGNLTAELTVADKLDENGNIVALERDVVIWNGKHALEIDVDELHTLIVMLGTIDRHATTPTVLRRDTARVAADAEAREALQ
ncbi:MAG: hypothetical protein GX610_22955 [Rhodococcus sp.]|nr:hypothetical protein [Rhodococcus sp. (in: high G+C Gram-positive bacteria)]